MTSLVMGCCACLAYNIIGWSVAVAASVYGDAGDGGVIKCLISVSITGTFSR